jgi:hypothetical protein
MSPIPDQIEDRQALRIDHNRFAVDHTRRLAQAANGASNEGIAVREVISRERIRLFEIAACRLPAPVGFMRLSTTTSVTNPGELHALIAC